MAKAKLVLPDGTSVTIEGNADEVANVLSKFSHPSEATLKPIKKKGQTSTDKGRSAKKKKDGPTSLITELTEEGYFKSKRTLGDVQKKLEERGHIYETTSISPILTRLTKSRKLRRLKEKKVWVYAN